jgi:hypothetical protein
LYQRIQDILNKINIKQNHEIPITPQMGYLEEEKKKEVIDLKSWHYAEI